MAPHHEITRSRCRAARGRVLEPAQRFVAHTWADHSKDYSRAILDWQEAHGRRVVNGRSVVEMEVSKVCQLTALRAFGIDVPKTVAVIGNGGLRDAARGFPTPFITKHNQGGKVLGVRRFDRLDDFEAYMSSDEFNVPVDGITLLPEYVEPREPSNARVETVGYEYVYAIMADTARGGFQLCPADACERDDQGQPKAAESLFELREGFAHPITGQLLGFARTRHLEIAGFELIEAADGRVLFYDVNTNTNYNYNPDVEKIAPKSGPGAIATYPGKRAIFMHAALVHPVLEAERAFIELADDRLGGRLLDPDVGERQRRGEVADQLAGGRRPAVKGD